MTVTTTQGEIWTNKVISHGLGGQLTMVKVGTGTAPESENSLGLDNQIYSSTPIDDVTLTDLGDTTEFTIDLHGGQNVPIGSNITEIGTFVSGSSVDFSVVDELKNRLDEDGDLMYARSVRSGTTLGNGEGTQAYIDVPWDR